MVRRLRIAVNLVSGQAEFSFFRSVSFIIKETISPLVPPNSGLEEKFFLPIKSTFFIKVLNLALSNSIPEEKAFCEIDKMLTTTLIALAEGFFQ